MVPRLLTSKDFLKLFTINAFLGVANAVPHIIGGQTTKISEHPYSAFLEIRCDRKTTICGGSIVLQMIVLTAAHCFKCTPEETRVTAIVGHEQLLKGIPYAAKTFKIHEKYDSVTVENDIALVLLEKPIEMIPGRVMKVMLAPRMLPEKMAAVAGWGIVKEGGDRHSPVLKSVDQVIISKSECSNLARYPAPPGTFCAGLLFSVSHPAEGDSGGALVVQNYVQEGIVSYKEEASLTVYTSVPYFYQWINVNVHRLLCL